MQLYTKILIGMALGVVLGFFLGPNSRFMEPDAATLSKAKVLTEIAGDAAVPQAKGIDRVDIIGEERRGDSLWYQVQWALSARHAVKLTAAGVEAKSGATYSGWVKDHPAMVRLYSSFGQTLVDWTEWLGRLFLAMIKMVVVPLVFFSLVVGIAGLGDFRKLARMGGVTLGFFTFTTVIALGIGLLLANVLAPGDLISEADRAILLGSYSAERVVSDAAGAPGFVDQLVNIVPNNPIKSLAEGNMLQIIFFAAAFGVALTLIAKEKAAKAIGVLDAFNEAVVMLVHMAMKLAPVGVAAILFQVVGTTGLSVLAALAYYGFVVILGLLVHITITYLPFIRYGAKLPFFGFLGGIKSALVLAFSTSSSSATLPVTMESCESRLNVSPEVTSFVLPIGATVNMDGTALYQGVAAIFIAQIYDIDLSFGEQLTVVVSATMASIGAAGVPGAGMVTLAMVLTAINVPVQGIALIIGVDRVLDMFRTTTNVIGDSTATVLVARMQGDALRIISDDEDKADPLHGLERDLSQPKAVRPHEPDGE